MISFREAQMKRERIKNKLRTKFFFFFHQRTRTIYNRAFYYYLSLDRVFTLYHNFLIYWTPSIYVIQSSCQSILYGLCLEVSCNIKLCAQLIKSQWFLVQKIGFDGGSEFRAEFWEWCANISIKTKPREAWNPQSNSVLERVHQVLGDCLKCFNLEEKGLNLKP